MLFATLTSSISMLEIVVSIGIRSKYDRRRRAAYVFGALIFIIGIPSALSFGVLSDWHVFGGTIFDFADLLTSRIGMPIGALLVSIFAGFILTKQQTSDELEAHPIVHTIWKFLIRYAAPTAIVVIFGAWIYELLK